MGSAKRETVIIVHGTFAAPEPLDNSERKSKWFEPGESFCQKLDAALLSLGSPARCWNHLNDLTSNSKYFRWTGNNLWLDRRKAAEDLRKHLYELYTSGWITHVVAHSHGGNIVLDALPELEDWYHPSWFRGKIVFFGTPILLTTKVDAETASRAYLALRVWGIPIFWFGILSAAIFWQTEWLSFFSWYNLLALGLALFLVFAAYVAFYFFAHTILPSITQQRANQGRLDVAEHLLLINSRFDEAFQILKRVKNERNPFLKKQHDDVGSSVQNGSDRSFLSYAHESVLKTIRAVDERNFYIEWKPPYYLALLCCLVIVVYATTSFVGVLPILSSWLALDIVLVNVAILIVISSGYPRAWLAALGLPLRLIIWVFSYIWRMALTIILWIGDSAIKQLSWRTLQAFVFGLMGAPYRVSDQEVELEALSRANPTYTYLELPDDLVASVLERRADDLKAGLTKVMERSLGENYGDALINTEVAGLFANTLVHTCYYEQPLCIRKAAQWLAAPLRLHDAEMAMALGLDTWHWCPYRDSDQFDPRFDDPKKCWSL